ncbi:hypothetical protein [Agarivorans sp. 1_MG-2023]|uniref:hypothetical protein n=1 Tax=Agarivorans sp. 1_MG-2023 TaxID=3062634 RepID=UPI0026E18B89|nr:hypothetical protein [Agarivorans sp. 1_MG-2023]MDO6763403.1 hypothetical protein [Agarivorans sp. 1_MG-2023]
MDGSFSKRVAEKLKAVTDRSVGASAVAPKGLDSTLRTYEDSIVRGVVHHCFNVRKVASEESNLTSYTEYLINKNGGRPLLELADNRNARPHINNSYGQLYNQNKQLLDLLKQEAKADRQAKFRFFVLRMATGIGIAAIVLATGYLAQKLGIPLPMLRIAT